MSRGYNFYNLEAPFKNFLSSGNNKISPISVNNYLSDLRHFLGWLTLTTQAEDNEIDPETNYAEYLARQLNSESVSNYLAYLENNNIPRRTINRRLSTLRRFCAFCIAQNWIETNPASHILNIRPPEKPTEPSKTSAFFYNNQALESPNPDNSRSDVDFMPVESGAEKSSKMGSYIAIVIVLVIFSVIATGIYNRFIRKTTPSLASTEELKQGSSSRFLTLQSKLADKLGNPVIETTDFQFKLYDVAEGGNPVYNSGVCHLTPDFNGVLTVSVGGTSSDREQNSCGGGIPERIFSNSANLYLGITMGTDKEASPRQPIANVGYAANAQALGGLALGASSSAVPYLNSDGDILLAGPQVGIKSTSQSGNFTISSSNNLVLQAGQGVGGPGDIILQATGSGHLKFRTGGESETNTRLFISDVGNIAVGNTTASQLLTLGSFEQLKINSSGNLTTSGDLVASEVRATDELELDNGQLNLSGTSGNIILTGFGTTSVTSTRKNGTINSFVGSLLAPTAEETANLFNLGLTNNSTNTSGVSTTTGLNITIGNNASGLNGTMDTYGIRIQDISGTAHDGNQRNYGIRIGNVGLSSTETSYGLFIDSQSGSATSYAAVFTGGNVGIGTDGPANTLDIDGGLTVRDLPSTSSTSMDTLYVDSDGKVFKGSSSLRYKKNVGLMAQDEYGKILDIDPKIFQYKTTGISDIGLIAEELDAAGLQYLVVYDNQNRPDSVRYDRIPVYLLGVIKDQQKQIASLFEKVAELPETFTSNNNNGKIISPIVETDDLQVNNQALINEVATNVIAPEEKDLTVDLEEKEPQDNSESGPLARIIIKGLNGKTVSTIDAAGNATFSGTLVAKEATVEGTITARKFESKEASISGKLTAKEIESETISELRDRLTNALTDSGNAKLTGEQLSASVNEIQATLADIRNQPLADPNYYQDLDEDSIGSFEQLTITGTSNLYNATVINSFSAGKVAIENDKILSLDSELKLTALATVNILDGAVTIARDGTLTTKGTLIAQGGIKTNKIEPINQGEKVQIDNLSTNAINISDKYLEATDSAVLVSDQDNFERNGLFAPAIEAEKQTAGNGILPAESSEVVIYNDSVKENSLIYLTPTSQTDLQLTVVKKEICPPTQSVEECRPYFKVSAHQSNHPNIGFNWLIIN